LEGIVSQAGHDSVFVLLRREVQRSCSRRDWPAPTALEELALYVGVLHADANLAERALVDLVPHAAGEFPNSLGAAAAGSDGDRVEAARIVGGRHAVAKAGEGRPGCARGEVIRLNHLFAAKGVQVDGGRRVQGQAAKQHGFLNWAGRPIRGECRVRELGRPVRANALAGQSGGLEIEASRQNRDNHATAEAVAGGVVVACLRKGCQRVHKLGSVIEITIHAEALEVDVAIREPRLVGHLADDVRHVIEREGRCVAHSRDASYRRRDTIQAARTKQVASHSVGDTARGGSNGSCVYTRRAPCESVLRFFRRQRHPQVLAKIFGDANLRLALPDEAGDKLHVDHRRRDLVSWRDTLRVQSR